MELDLSRRRLLLGAASLGVAAPFIAMAPEFAYAEGDRLVVRILRDLQNLDPANRTGAPEVNVILVVGQGLVKEKADTPFFLSWLT